MIIILLVAYIIVALVVAAKIHKYIFKSNRLDNSSFSEIITIIKGCAEKLIESAETSMVNSTGLEKMNYVVSSIFKIISKLDYLNITEATIRVIAQQVYDNMKAKRVLSEEALHSLANSTKVVAISEPLDIDQFIKDKSMDHDELVEKIADTVDDALKQINITIDRSKIKTVIVDAYNSRRDMSYPGDDKMNIDASISSDNLTKLSEDHDSISQE